MWKRYRFHANYDDSRPVIFPPPGPWWETGYGEDFSTVVAYLPEGEDLKRFWPEATNITTQDAPEGPQFSGRFPKPDWWKG